MAAISTYHRCAVCDDVKQFGKFPRPVLQSEWLHDTCHDCIRKGNHPELNGPAPPRIVEQLKNDGILR